MRQTQKTPITCLFCQIANGEVAVHTVHRTDDIIAFLDTHPIRPGHLQIMPTDHFAYFEGIPTDIAHQIMDIARRLAPVLKTVFGVSRVAFLYTGRDIPHAHLVPLHHKHDNHVPPVYPHS